MLFRSAEEGDQEAARLLERMRAEGRQIWRLQDDLETMEERLEIDTLHEMAAQGLAEAQRDLGIRYLQGRGLPRDVMKGRELLRQAAEQGDAEAKKLLDLSPVNFQVILPYSASFTTFFFPFADR